MNNRFFYAQLEDLKVIAVSDLSGEVIAPNLIRLQSLSDAKLGDTYENGQFITPPQVAENE